MKKVWKCKYGFDIFAPRLNENMFPLQGVVIVKKSQNRGVEQLVARGAHNAKVGGSSPSPATKFSRKQYFRNGMVATASEIEPNLLNKGTKNW